MHRFIAALAFSLVIAGNLACREAPYKASVSFCVGLKLGPVHALLLTGRIGGAPFEPRGSRVYRALTK